MSIPVDAGRCRVIRRRPAGSGQLDPHSSPDTLASVPPTWRHGQRPYCSKPHATSRHEAHLIRTDSPFRWVFASDRLTQCSRLLVPRPIFPADEVSSQGHVSRFAGLEGAMTPVGETRLSLRWPCSLRSRAASEAGSVIPRSGADIPERRVWTGDVFHDHRYRPGGRWPPRRPGSPAKRELRPYDDDERPTDGRDRVRIERRYPMPTTCSESRPGRRTTRPMGSEPGKAARAAASSCGRTATTKPIPMLKAR